MNKTTSFGFVLAVTGVTTIGDGVTVVTGSGVGAGVAVGVIISDTFGRPWRDGLVDVAIGVAGMEALRDYRDLPDTEGRIMKVTAVAVADEIASAAELVMGKLDRVPVALVRGFAYTAGDGGVGALIRPPEKDLFR